MNDLEVERRLAHARDHILGGRLSEAEREFLAILHIHPQHPGALHGLAQVALRAGDSSKAHAALGVALEAAPNDIELILDMARANQAQQDAAEAEVFARLAVMMEPSSVAARLVLADVLSSSGQRIGAIRELLRAHELQPSHADIRLRLEQSRLATGFEVLLCQPSANVCHRIGSELEKRGRHVDAADQYRRALAQQSDSVAVLIRLAVLHQQWEDLDTAIELYQKALSQEPASAQALCNLGIALQQLQRHTEALDAFDKARRASPDSPIVGINRAMLLLLLGNWEEGWEEYEWRWKLARRRRPAVAPTWDGSVVRHRSLILFAELGMGDTIQMLRYLRLVSERMDPATGARLLLACQQPLRRLISGIPGIELVEPEAETPPLAYEMPLGSLPGLFKTRPDSVPPQPKTLFVPENSLAAERVRLLPKPRVGLVWAGGSDHLNNATRSMPLAFLRSLVAATDCSIISLQKGTAENELKDTDFSSSITSLSHLLSDMAETAAVIRQLDLVISVDTSVAHLAGTLDKPTWLLLPYASEWRWLLGVETTAWYPSMKIFRQHRRGDWPELVDRVSGELRKWCHGRT
jgi:tetratricopeptide (TPR) repeat protein